MNVANLQLEGLLMGQPHGYAVPAGVPRIEPDHGWAYDSAMTPLAT